MEYSFKPHAPTTGYYIQQSPMTLLLYDIIMWRQNNRLNHFQLAEESQRWLAQSAETFPTDSFTFLCPESPRVKGAAIPRMLLKLCLHAYKSISCKTRLFDLFKLFPFSYPLLIVCVMFNIPSFDLSATGLDLVINKQVCQSSHTGSHNDSLILFCSANLESILEKLEVACCGIAKS